PGAPPRVARGGPAPPGVLGRAATDEFAGLIGASPGPVAGLGAPLPMNDAEAAAGELERAMSQLGALGAQLHTNVGGVPLDEPRFDAIFGGAASREGMLWIHPTRRPIWADYPAESRSRYRICWSRG